VSELGEAVRGPEAANGARPAQEKAGTHREATLYHALAGAGAGDGRTLDELRAAAREAYESLPLPVWRRSGFWTTSLAALDLEALETTTEAHGGEPAGVPDIVARTLPDAPFAGRIVQSGSPREVYGRPDNRTVAHFLGSANFLRGRIVEAGDGLATVELADGAVAGLGTDRRVDDGAQQGRAEAELVLAHAALEDDALDGAFDRAARGIEMGRYVLGAEDHVDGGAGRQRRARRHMDRGTAAIEGHGREAVAWSTW